MMIEPPIDKLIEKVGCKYSLCCLITKRARYLQDQMPQVLLDAKTKSVSYAAKEVYDGSIRATIE